MVKPEIIAKGASVMVRDADGGEHPATVIMAVSTARGVWYQVAVKGGPVVNLPEKNVRRSDGQT